jgi:hypothetical protein
VPCSYRTESYPWGPISRYDKDLSDLNELFEELPKEFGAEFSEAEHRLVEALTFSDARAILAFVDQVNARDYLAIPVWLRNLCYRLAVLQRPNDSELLRKAAIDLELFGPDWDSIAAELRARADAIESNR